MKPQHIHVAGVGELLLSYVLDNVYGCTRLDVNVSVERFRQERFARYNHTVANIDFSPIYHPKFHENQVFVESKVDSFLD